MNGLYVVKNRVVEWDRATNAINEGNEDYEHLEKSWTELEKITSELNKRFSNENLEFEFHNVLRYVFGEECQPSMKAARLRYLSELTWDSAKEELGPLASEKASNRGSKRPGEMVDAADLASKRKKDLPAQ